MNLEEITMRLVGPVQPTGEHDEDRQRLANMKSLTLLIEGLLCQVRRAAREADRQEASVRAIGQHAAEFLQDIKGVD